MRWQIKWNHYTNYNNIAKTKYNFILELDFYNYLKIMDYAQEAINQHKKYR